MKNLRWREFGLVSSSFLHLNAIDSVSIGILGMTGSCRDLIFKHYLQGGRLSARFTKNLVTSRVYCSNLLAKV